MEWLATFRDWPWEYIGTMGTALIGGIWTVYTFAKERREDRKWKQIEFLLNLNQKFIESADFKDCIRRLDNMHQLSSLRAIFESERATLTDDEIQILEKFRSLFQFFDNLHRCFEMKALALDQIDLFGWYLYRINNIDFIRNYCMKNGFENVVVLADRLLNYAYSSA